MPNIRFQGYWTEEYQKRFDIPKGFIVIEYDSFYRKNIGKTLMKLDDFQKKKFEKAAENAKKENGEIKRTDFMRKLTVDIYYSYNKATLDQKALIWSLYKIEANEQNGGMSGAGDQMVTEMELYLNDLNDPSIGERETITTRRHNLMSYLSDYRIIEAVTASDGTEYTLKKYLETSGFDDEKITIRVVRGLSKMNTVQAAKLADRIFNRLNYHGVSVTNPGEIGDYWQKWKQHLNDEKVIIHDAVMTQKEYKSLTPICEACGQFIAEGEGNLSHIKSIGMGGDRTKEPKENYTSNWLHLHQEPCHLTDWHQGGVKSFLKKYPHLSYKVNTALSRDYAPFDNKDKSTINEKEQLKKKHNCLECGEVFESDNEIDNDCPVCKGEGLY